MLATTHAFTFLVPTPPAAKQAALEAAIKAHPASEGKERWDNIAADVPGRSRKDCVKRYKELVKKFAEDNQ